MEKKKEVPCKRDCIYFDFKGDDAVCKLMEVTTWYDARDLIDDEICICKDYKN